MNDVPEWKTLEENPPKLQHEFVFEDFSEAMKFVNKVADLAQFIDHHPDITINYRKVTLTLYTHDSNGISEKDFALAQKINQLV